MKISEIKELLDLIEQYPVDILKVEKQDFKLYYQRQNATSAVINVTEPNEAAGESVSMDDEPTEKIPGSLQTDNSFHKIKSPMIGTFYSRPKPEAEPFVQVGTVVEKDQPICVLEAMKLLNEVNSDVNGEIIEVLVEDGQVIEFGQPLFIVKMEGAE